MKIFLTVMIAVLFAVTAGAQTAPAAKKQPVPVKKTQTRPVQKAAAKPAAKPEVAASTAAAQGAKPDRSAEVIAGLKAWDAQLTSLKAGFTQQVLFKEAGLKQTVEGSLTYVKPNFLRIEHSKPVKQVIVTDKQDIWIYKPDDKQAVNTSWDAWRRTQDQNFSGILDFGNYAKLTEMNNIAVSGGENGAPITAVFTPRSGAQYSLTLRLSADFFPSEAELAVESTVIATRLTGVEKNTGAEKDLFKFTPPNGTEVIKLNK